MKIVYYSLVGNVRRFLAKTELPAQPIGDYDVDEPFVIVTNTLGFGEVPEPVARFLVRNVLNLVGVASSGNRNWGENFGKAADTIGKVFDVPVLLKFELSGTDEDVRIFTERVREIDEIYRTE